MWTNEKIWPLQTDLSVTSTLPFMYHRTWTSVISHEQAKPAWSFNHWTESTPRQTTMPRSDQHELQISNFVIIQQQPRLNTIKNSKSQWRGSEQIIHSTKWHKMESLRKWTIPSETYRSSSTFACIGTCLWRRRWCRQSAFGVEM